MQLFYWTDCRALTRYSSGYIAAIAPDIETAREKVIAQAEDWYRARHCYLFDNEGVPYDEDDNSKVAEFIASVTEDLSDAPLITDVIFIEGSE